MNRTEELLKKYFAGESSLSEEKELKGLFASGNISAEHQKYAPIFGAIRREKQTKLPANTEIQINKKRFYQTRWFYFVSTAVAACTLILFTIGIQQSPNDYLIINGKRINDSEKAREFANAKLEKSLSVVKRNLAVYSDNAEIQQKLKEIENQLK